MGILGRGWVNKGRVSPRYYQINDSEAVIKLYFVLVILFAVPQSVMDVEVSSNDRGKVKMVNFIKNYIEMILVDSI